MKHKRLFPPSPLARLGFCPATVDVGRWCRIVADKGNRYFNVLP